MDEAHGSCNQYPPVLASYEDVIHNPELFMDTLEKLHTAMGTKFMVPIIGGKELDLHRLFVEVTSRGGIEKVIRDRRWKEVTAIFSFPSTATNASFVLRKYYISLLHHYEQLYFFGVKGWKPPSATQANDASAQTAIIPMEAVSEVQDLHDKHRRDQQELSSGLPVVGVIDGKFDHGYLVTVTVGTEKLKGVLYRTLENPSAASVLCPAGDANALSATGKRRRRRKKSEIRKRDPAHPKPNRSGYNFFFAEQHARLKPLHPGKDREISRMIGNLWNKLSDIEKAVYQERGLKDKERYQSEMEIYRERQRALPVIAIPIQQRPPDCEKLEVQNCRLPESASIESSSEDENHADKSTETETSSDQEMDEMTCALSANGAHVS